MMNGKRQTASLSSRTRLELRILWETLLKDVQDPTSPEYIPGLGEPEDKEHFEKILTICDLLGISYGLDMQEVEIEQLVFRLELVEKHDLISHVSDSSGDVRKTLLRPLGYISDDAVEDSEGNSDTLVCEEVDIPSNMRVVGEDILEAILGLVQDPAVIAREKAKKVFMAKIAAEFPFEEPEQGQLDPNAISVFLSGQKETTKEAGVWLAGIMLRYPDGMPEGMTKEHLKTEAKQRFAVSSRVFDTIWSVAQGYTGVTSWSKTGPKKSK